MANRLCQMTQLIIQPAPYRVSRRLPVTAVLKYRRRVPIEPAGPSLTLPHRRGLPVPLAPPSLLNPSPRTLRLPTASGSAARLGVPITHPGEIRLSEPGLAAENLASRKKTHAAQPESLSGQSHLRGGSASTRKLQGMPRSPSQ